VRTEADEKNLSDTARRVEALIQRAQQHNEKIICFVTGVPGAGKTLVGLNIATSHRENDDTHAVFLSGNGPLVTVLREALTRDDVARRMQRGERVAKKRPANQSRLLSRTCIISVMKDFETATDRPLIE
jgi:adenylylsulfate kinase-like enzyme